MANLKRNRNLCHPQRSLPLLGGFPAAGAREADLPAPGTCPAGAGRKPGCRGSVWTADLQPSPQCSRQAGSAGGMCVGGQECGASLRSAAAAASASGRDEQPGNSCGILSRYPSVHPLSARAATETTGRLSFSRGKHLYPREETAGDL